MLELKDIHWSLEDGTEIIKGIDLKIKPGKMTVITGPNGGGKTSLAKIIAGLETPSKGAIEMDGTDITGWDITKRAQNGIAYAFQQPVCFKGLTVGNLLELAAGKSLEEAFMCDILGEVGLCSIEYIHRPMDASLSGGERKRIEIAMVLARGAKFAVFDEPEAGIDLWSFSSLIEAFERLKKEQEGALLVISHQERLLEIADEIVVLADGKVRIAGSAEEVMPKLLAGEKTGMCPLKEGGNN